MGILIGCELRNNNQMLIDTYCLSQENMLFVLNQPAVQPDMSIGNAKKSMTEALDSLNILIESKKIILKQEKNGATRSWLQFQSCTAL